MNEEYKRGWGILVGRFSESDLLKNKDEIAVALMQKKYPKLQMVNTKEVKERGVRKLEVYICSNKDFKMRMW